MKLLLTSSGITNSELENTFSDLIENRTNLKVAIIPTAGDPIDWITSELPGYDTIPKINEQKLKENLSKKVKRKKNMNLRVLK